MNKKILIVATLVFALAFVAVLAVMNSGLLSTASNANKKLSNTLSMTSDYELETYNGTTVTGDTVISAIKNAKTLSSNTKLEIEVKTKEGATDKYGFVDGKDDFTDYTETDSRDNDFINPTANFEASLTKNDNDIITGIEFVQE
ncbi:hypothetical protein WG909_13930 [Peptostreptococcaceae bacterium AGR-M142]